MIIKYLWPPGYFPQKKSPSSWVNTKQRQANYQLRGQRLRQVPIHKIPRLVALGNNLGLESNAEMFSRSYILDLH